MVDELDIQSIATDGMLAYRNYAIQYATLGYFNGEESPTPEPVIDRSRRRRGGSGSSTISINKLPSRPDDNLFHVKFQTTIEEINRREYQGSQFIKNQERRYFKDEDRVQFRVNHLKIDRDITPSVQVVDVEQKVVKPSTKIVVENIEVKKTSPFVITGISTKQSGSSGIKITTSLIKT